MRFLRFLTSWPMVILLVPNIIAIRLVAERATIGALPPASNSLWERMWDVVLVLILAMDVGQVMPCRAALLVSAITIAGYVWLAFYAGFVSNATRREAYRGVTFPVYVYGRVFPLLGYALFFATILWCFYLVVSAGGCLQR